MKYIVEKLSKEKTYALLESLRRRFPNSKSCALSPNHWRQTQEEFNEWWDGSLAKSSCQRICILVGEPPVVIMTYNEQPELPKAMRGFVKEMSVAETVKAFNLDFKYPKKDAGDYTQAELLVMIDSLQASFDKQMGALKDKVRKMSEPKKEFVRDNAGRFAKKSYVAYFKYCKKGTRGVYEKRRVKLDDDHDICSTDKYVKGFDLDRQEARTFLMSGIKDGILGIVVVKEIVNLPLD